MYAGNGAAKKFIIPDGYDGSVVILELPSGKTIRMQQNEGYKVEGDCVVFDAAIPSGIKIKFEEDENSEVMKSSGYVVIYGDGKIEEVNEDPVKYLEEAQNLLRDSEKQSAYITEISERTTERIRKLGEETADKLDSELYRYEQRASGLMSETSTLLKTEIRMEAEAVITHVTETLRQINTGLIRMEEIREEIRGISSETARETEEKILEENREVIEIYEKIEAIKAEVKELSEEAKYAADSACREAQVIMNTKVNEELEMLKSLRLRLENDEELVMSKINNAWEILKREVKRDE